MGLHRGYKVVALSLLFWGLVAPVKAMDQVQILGDVSHFEWKDQVRINGAARDLAQQSGQPVCVAVSDKSSALYNLVMTCGKGIVLAFDLEGQDVNLTVPPNTELGSKLTPEVTKLLIGRDMLELLRRGKGAEGIVNGLEGLVLVLQGKYEKPPPGWVVWTWPFILLATILALWAIARQGEGRGKGSGILIDPEGYSSDLHFPSESENPPAETIKVLYGRW